MVNGRTNIGRDVQTFSKGDDILPVTRVIIDYGIDDDGKTLIVEAVKTPDTGRTIELDIETITDATNAQYIADFILNQYQGDTYRSVTATGGELDPAAELGDGITVNSITTMLGAIDTVFNQGMFADFESVGIDDLDEFPYGNYQSKAQRKQERDYRKNYAYIKAATNRIELVVGRMDEAESRIDQTAESIRFEVERASASEGAISTTLEQTASGIIAEIQDHENTQKRYIQYNTEGLSLGSGNSKKRTLITDEKVSFYNETGGEEANVGSAGFNMKTGKVENQLNFGDHWALIPTSDGHITLKWRT